MNVLLPPNRLNPNQPAVLPVTLPMHAPLQPRSTIPSKIGARMHLVGADRVLVPAYVGVDSQGNAVLVDNRGIYRDPKDFMGWVL